MSQRSEVDRRSYSRHSRLSFVPCAWSLRDQGLLTIQPSRCFEVTPGAPRSIFAMGICSSCRSGHAVVSSIKRKQKSCRAPRDATFVRRPSRHKGRFAALKPHRPYGHDGSPIPRRRLFGFFVREPFSTLGLPPDEGLGASLGLRWLPGYGYERILSRTPFICFS